MANNWVDFKAVKDAVTFEMVLDHFQINGLRKEKQELVGPCPIHQGEGDRAFHVSLRKSAFNCFSCKARGNVLDFVAAMEKCSMRDAALKLTAWFSIPIPEQGGKRKEPAASTTVGESTLVNKPLSFQLKTIDHTHPYLDSRGISKETAVQFGVGFFAGKGSMSGRIVFPIHNDRGELVAYAGRAIDDSEPRYKFPAGFHKSLVFYNLHRVLQKNSADAVVLVEGFFDCLKVAQAGHLCLALMGSSLSATQEEIVCQHFGRAVLLFDGDDPGRKATEECLLRLGRRMWVTAVALPDAKQPDQLSTDELNQLLGSR
jgi:DNA primase